MNKKNVVTQNCGSRISLSREQMKKIVGGIYMPCASECTTDQDCQARNPCGLPFGSCVIITDCHNRDGSMQPNVGSCVLPSWDPSGVC